VGALTGLLRPVRPTTTRNDTSKGANIQIVRYLFKADFFKVLGHPLRIQILDELRNGPVSVGELRERLQVEQSTLSQQLALLRARNFVQTQRQGTSIIYSVSDPAIWRLLDVAREVFDNQLVSVQTVLEDARRMA
jgi:DNA-binding transcriptional ArsR family regulator